VRTALVQLPASTSTLLFLVLVALILLFSTLLVLLIPLLLVLLAGLLVLLALLILRHLAGSLVLLISHMHATFYHWGCAVLRRTYRLGENRLIAGEKEVIRCVDADDCGNVL
jgi:hypothetical protein